MITDEVSARAWVEKLPECDAAALGRLQQFIAMLRAENGNQNLVSASSLSNVWQRHIADSAQLLSYVPRGTGAAWLDLGTGAGFPGLVIAVLRPDAEVLLVEPRAKRTEWLEHAVSVLGLPNTRVLASRLERVATQPVSTISARAFAPLDRLLKLSARFSTPTTRWLLPKGRSAAHELQELTGWHHLFHVEQSLTDHDAGIIVGQLIGKARQSR